MRLKIEDPTGETRTYPLPSDGSAVTVGRDPEAAIPLRGGARVSATLYPGAPTWLRVPDGAPPARLGGVEVRECALPPGLALLLGEARLSLEELEEEAGAVLPPFPEGGPAWLTSSASGSALLRLARRAAATPLAVYLEGETGTGKEILAQLLHAWSDRAEGPFVPLNCAALPLSLAESELFGHVKGAFTGAITSRPGALLQAHGGTLFLDEVADLPPELQVKLLRFLENGELRPVGADRTRHASVRLVCATHRRLRDLVAQGAFRRDLYYRLASVAIEIPPLRDRLEDVALLARKFAAAQGREILPSALLRLKAHGWPGNVRELRHAIERAAGMGAPGPGPLDAEAFDFLLERGEPNDRSEEWSGPGLAPLLTLEEMEGRMLQRALRVSGGSRLEAARLLGVGRSTIFGMMRKHGLMEERAAR